jgi:FtsP/CotA-like multicopper oxidase with cupredoxin domain
MAGLCLHKGRQRARAWLARVAGALGLLLPLLPAQAQAPVPPAPSAAPAAPATPQGLLQCDPIIGQPLVKVPEIVSSNGVLRGTILLSDHQERMAFRTPPSAAPGPDDMKRQVCQPQYVRYFSSPDAVPPVPPPDPGQYPDPLPGPTLRARVGDVVELTFFNNINPADFGDSIDRGENGVGCDQTSGGGDNKGYPASAGDEFPNCLHGSSTGNIHFHGTHTNPNGTGDNVLIEVRPAPRAANQPTIIGTTFKEQFDKFFAECEKRLKADVLAEWPLTWDDAPLGPPSDPNTYTGMQKKLLLDYDDGRPLPQQLWPIDKLQYDQGFWPQYYIGAYPYCFRVPEYSSRTWPPAPSAMHAGVQMGPMEAPASLQMGQSPGTHWYHAHKHGSTAINVANGMTGAFIIEGRYDDELNAFYGPGWTRTQPVLVINQLGVSPNLLRVGPGRTFQGPDFSVNGRLQPHIKMRPGEVQMWRVLDTSGRSGAFFVGPPKSDPTAKEIDPAKDFEWRQLAQDGVQFSDSNYQKSLNERFLMAAGNRLDLLVKAPTHPTRTSYDVLVQHEVAKSDLATAANVPLITVDIEGSGPEMQFIKRAPTMPPDLADITDDEIKGTKLVEFKSEAPGSEHQMTIDGKQYSGDRGAVVLLNTTEEWTIRNATVAPAIDHPFHIHINPFQVTEVFDPNEKITDPSTNQLVNKYVFDAAYQKLAGQCLLDPNDPDTWKPCVKNRQPYRIWYDVFPIPSGLQISSFGRTVVVPGFFKMRSRFVDYPGLFVMHCHILAHEDRGMMAVVDVVPRRLPYAHQ